MDEQPNIAANRAQELKNEMLFTLSNRDSGTLAIVVTGSEKQTKELQAFLKEHLTEYQFYPLDLTSYAFTSLDKALTELLPEKIKNSLPAEWVVNITGLENNIYRNKDGKIEYSALLPQMNFEREQLFKQPQILILWMSKSFYTELRKKAPDLMHWLSNRFIFDSEADSLDASEQTYDKGEIKEKGKIAKRTDRIIELEAAWEKLCFDHEDKERLIKDKINILILLGKEYREAFDATHSEEALKKALVLAERVKSTEAGMVYFELGNTYKQFYKFDKAVSFYQKSLAFDEAAHYENYLGVDYHQLGMAYAGLRKWPEALENYGKAIGWHEKTRNEYALGGSYHQLGTVYLEQRKWLEALENYGKSIEWQERTGNEFALGSSHHQIGMVYAEQRKWPEAMENYSKAIGWYEKTGNEYALGDSYHQLGMAYAGQGKWPKAMENYGKAIRWYEQTGNEYALGDSYHQIGTVYLEQRKWPEALENYGKAIGWYERTGNKFELGGTYHQIGRIYEEQRKWPDALENYGKAIGWKEKTGNEFKLSSSYHQIGCVYENQGNLEKAKQYFALSKENMEKFDDPNTIIVNESIERLERKLNADS